MDGKEIGFLVGVIIALLFLFFVIGIYPKLRTSVNEGDKILGCGNAAVLKIAGAKVAQCSPSCMEGWDELIVNTGCTGGQKCCYMKNAVNAGSSITKTGTTCNGALGGKNFINAFCSTMSPAGSETDFASLTEGKIYLKLQSSTCPSGSYCYSNKDCVDSNNKQGSCCSGDNNKFVKSSNADCQKTYGTGAQYCCVPTNIGKEGTACHANFVSGNVQTSGLSGFCSSNTVNEYLQDGVYYLKSGPGDCNAGLSCYVKVSCLMPPTQPTSGQIIPGASGSCSLIQYHADQTMTCSEMSLKYEKSCGLLIGTGSCCVKTNT